jgi:hypothetical protein
MPEESQQRSKSESAAGLLRVELQLASVEDFVRHAPGIPGTEGRLEVITNEARAVPFFESVLKELRIPGQVVVRGFP